MKKTIITFILFIVIVSYSFSQDYGIKAGIGADFPCDGFLNPGFRYGMNFDYNSPPTNGDEFKFYGSDSYQVHAYSFIVKNFYLSIGIIYSKFTMDNRKEKVVEMFEGKPQPYSQNYSIVIPYLSSNQIVINPYYQLNLIKFIKPFIGVKLSYNFIEFNDIAYVPAVPIPYYKEEIHDSAVLGYGMVLGVLFPLVKPISTFVSGSYDYWNFVYRTGIHVQYFNFTAGFSVKFDNF